MAAPLRDDESASDAALEGWVPSLDHATLEDWDEVYEPSEDTFLLLDALYGDRARLRAARPSLVVEIGPGSGAVSVYVARLLAGKGSSRWRGARSVAIDSNPRACALAARTAAANGVALDVIVGDLDAALRRGAVDVLIFNPPYVPTPSSEVASSGIEASWAGGVRGREVLDRLLPRVGSLLSETGAFYLVAVSENDVPDISRRLEDQGLVATTLAAQRARNEALSVLRFSRGGD